jgi:WD40 repeat protein
MLISAFVLALPPVCPAQELRQVAPFKGLSFPVGRALLSPDGKLLAAGGGDTRGGELKLWEAASGKEIAALPGFTNTLYCLAFSSDGKLLAAGGVEPVKVWDAASHKQVAAFPHLGAWVTLVAFSADGKRLGAAGGRSVKVWDVASGKELASFQHQIEVGGWLGLAFSPDLATLAARNYQEIDLWDVASGKERTTLSEHRGEVGCLVYSRDGKILLAASSRYVDASYKILGDLKLWDVASGKERAAFEEHLGHVSAAALNPDGKTVALVNFKELHGEADLRLLDVGTGRQRVIQPEPQYSFLSVMFTPEGKLLVVGSSEKSMKLWEVAVPPGEAK